MSDAWLNSDFRISDLTVTSQPAANIPSQSELRNLKELANVLSELKSKIGPFQIASAYRSPTVNSLVGGSNSSLHLNGMAADIIPLTMDIETYFTKIFANPTLKNKLGEITLKPPHGSLHLSLPTAYKQSVPMILDANGYRTLSNVELDSYLVRAKEFVTAQVTPITLAIAVLTLSSAFFIFSRARKKSQ